MCLFWICEIRVSVLNDQQESTPTQVLDNRPCALWADEHLAQLAAVSNTLEQREPLIGRRLTVSWDPLNASQARDGKQVVEVRDLVFTVQVVKTVI